MKHYVSCPKLWWSEPPDTQRTMVIIEPDTLVRDTGLVDHRGAPIKSVTETGPIGYVPFIET